MQAFSRVALLMLITRALVPQPAQAEDSLYLTLGFAKSVVVEGAVKGQFTAIIGNPKTADFTFGPKNTFWFIGLKEGATNVIVLDNSTGREMYAAKIYVAPYDPGTTRVQVHNKSLVTSYTVYRCSPGCTYVDEVTAQEPAALPRGHLDQTTVINSNTNLPGISGSAQSTTTIQSDFGPQR